MGKFSIKTDSLTTGDLDKIADLLDRQFDQRLAPLATKEFVEEKIDGLESNLKHYMHEGFDAVMEGLHRLSEQMAEREKLDRIVAWARQAGEKIGIKPKI